MWQTVLAVGHVAVNNARQTQLPSLVGLPFSWRKPDSKQIS